MPRNAPVYSSFYALNLAYKRTGQRGCVANDAFCANMVQLCDFLLKRLLSCVVVRVVDMSHWISTEKCCDCQI